MVLPMQTVTFNCDACGVKLPVVTDGGDSDTPEVMHEHRHYLVTVIPRTVHALPRMTSLPSHATSGLGRTYEMDLCQGCAETQTVGALLQAKTGRRSP